MSAPALHPTARVRPVLRERLARQRGAHGWAALFLVIMGSQLRLDSDPVSYSAAVVCVVLGGLVLPLLQAMGPRDHPPWDAVLPVDPARYALVRLVCGLAGAAFLLAVGTGVYAALFRDPVHPGWYPLALFAWGLSAYLLSSAALLGTGAPGGFVLSPALCLLSAPSLPALLQNPVELGRMGMTAVLARTVLPLGLAGAAAYAAARFQARAPAPANAAFRRPPAPHRDPAPVATEVGRVPAPRADHPARALPDRPAPRRAGPARPSATLTVFWRHFALLCRFAIVPALTLLLFALLVLMLLAAGPDEAGEAQTLRWFVESTGLRWWCAWIAISWTGLVWLGERASQRRWNDALPVGTGRRRILHVAAGAAWLLPILTVVVAAPVGAAMAAGTLSSPADVPAGLWFGIPCRTLSLYLVATFVLFGTPVAFHASPGVAANVFVRVLPSHTPGPLVGMVMALGMGAVLYIFFKLGTGLLKSQVLALGSEAGSSAASALWLVLSAAAAAGAIALNDWIYHRDRLPTLHEVRGFLPEWAGTRPAPPLSSHPGP